MKLYRHTRGFTLIELLVVIAIIGLLSAIVLASLNSARGKGADAAIKSTLANTRVEAALFYDNNNTVYTGVCALTGTSVIGDSVEAALTAQGKTVTAYDTVAETCFAGASGWAASVPLRTNSALYFCVDGNGAATTTAAYRIGAADFDCNT